jgi:hypothetical protein
MTNQNKQTAVEWQYIELSKFLNGKSEFTHKSDILIKAKEMEKEQRISDYYQGACDESDSHGAQYICKSDAEQWYNKTYGGNK